MPARPTTSKAIAQGRRAADRVLAARAAALRRRTAALRRLERERAERRAVAPPPAPRLLRRVGGPATAGVLVAEGDSWFDYPWTDVLQVLEDDFAWDVESVAHKGDRVEDMAYGGGQLLQLTRRIEKVVRGGSIPHAILISGGGNDVAGDEFATLLEHAESPSPGLNEAMLVGVVDQRIRLAYTTILAAVARVCEQVAGRRIPVLVHGYDYPVADGRGFLGGFFALPGPWLEPGFRRKGYAALDERDALTRKLIDRFGQMLAGVAAVPELDHVHFVDLRGTLSTGSDYKRDWENELHPTIRGFRAITAKFQEVLAGLP